MKIWADEQVSLICQKSLFTFKYIQQSQEDKIEGLDVRNKPEGHIIVTKEEQDQVLKDKIVDAEMKAAEVKAKASEQNSQKDSEEASVVSDMPSPMTEAHNIKVENLQW